MRNLFNYWTILCIALLISFSITSCSDSPSSSETEIKPDFEYLFQWHTSGFIESNRRNNEIWGVDLLITDETGEVLGSFELFNENDGLLQFLPVDEFDLNDIPQQMSVSLVYYVRWEFFDDVNYQTRVTTYTNIDSGIVIGGQNSKNSRGEFNVEFNLGSDMDELNSSSTTTVYFELLGIDNEFNDRFRISSYLRGTSGGTYNGEIKENIELDGINDNALFVSVYSGTLDPNSEPRYWIVDEITNSISLNFQEGYGELTEKVVSVPQGAEYITVGGAISVNGISLSLPLQSSFPSNDSAYLLYPIDVPISRSYYEYKEEGTDLRHSKYYFGEVFSEIEDPMSVQFEVYEANTDSVSINQSGDHNVFSISFSELDSNYRNSWIVKGVKGNDNFTMPNIDTHINTQHSNFYTKRLEFSPWVDLSDYDTFDKNLYLNYFLSPIDTNYRGLRMPIN